MNRFFIVVCSVWLFSSTTFGQMVSVDVVVKSVSSESRGLTVIYTTDLGEKTTTLDVSRNAVITVNGQEGTLDELKPGHKAKVEFEKNLAVITKVEASGEPLISELFVLPEIDGYYPSLTEDGLTIFWEAPTKTGPMICTAKARVC